jgi:hypothetical protein
MTELLLCSDPMSPDQLAAVAAQPPAIADRPEQRGPELRQRRRVDEDLVTLTQPRDARRRRLGEDGRRGVRVDAGHRQQVRLGIAFGVVDLEEDREGGPALHRHLDGVADPVALDLACLAAEPAPLAHPRGKRPRQRASRVGDERLQPGCRGEHRQLLGGVRLGVAGCGRLEGEPEERVRVERQRVR